MACDGIQCSESRQNTHMLAVRCASAVCTHHEHCRSRLRAAGPWSLMVVGSCPLTMLVTICVVALQLENSQLCCARHTDSTNALAAVPPTRRAQQLRVTASLCRGIAAICLCGLASLPTTPSVAAVWSPRLRSVGSCTGGRCACAHSGSVQLLAPWLHPAQCREVLGNISGGW